MKSLSFVFLLAPLVAGGAFGLGWQHLNREKHPAVEAFETFYWKLQKRDLVAAGAWVEPGSEAALALSAQSGVGAADPAQAPTARGFALDIDHESDGELAGRPVIHLYGQATVTVDPAGYTSAFGVAVSHEVEARMVEAEGGWRVATYRDVVLSP